MTWKHRETSLDTMLACTQVAEVVFDKLGDRLWRTLTDEFCARMSWHVMACMCTRSSAEMPSPEEAKGHVADGLALLEALDIDQRQALSS